MINSPKLTLTDEQQSQVKFDVTHAVEAIASWKAHMLRTVNQEQAKEETLVIIIMDLGNEISSPAVPRTNERFFTESGE